MNTKFAYGNSKGLYYANKQSNYGLINSVGLLSIFKEKLT